MPNPTTAPAPTNMAGFTVTTAVQTIAQRNPARNGLIITNLHATNTLSVCNSQNAAPTSLAAGTITIPANSSVQFGAGLIPVSGAVPQSFGFAWTDSMNAIASASGTPVTVTEF